MFLDTKLELAQSKDSQIHIRLSENEQAIVRKASAMKNSSMSQFLRGAVMAAARELISKEASDSPVYSNKDGEYFEDSNINPSQNAECLYSLAKFCSEELFNFFLIPKNVFVTNLRLSQVYGKRMRDDRIYKIMEAELLADNKITVWGNGERVSNFVPIDFVLKAILFFVINKTNGLFNVGGENISYEALAKKIISDKNMDNATIHLVDKGVKSKVYINSETNAVAWNENIDLDTFNLYLDKETT